MAELIFYFFPGTCARASLCALHEAGAKFEARLVNLFQGEHRHPDYLSLNRAGKVPTLLIDGEPLSETVAILHYINAEFPKAGLVPYNGERRHDAHLLSNLVWLNATVQPLLTRFRVPMVFTPNREAFRDIAIAGAEAMKFQFGTLEHKLAEREYLAGTFSALDLLATWLHDESSNAGLDTADFPRLRGLAERVNARPAVQAALAQEGEFIGKLAAAGELPPQLPRFL